MGITSDRQWIAARAFLHPSLSPLSQTPTKKEKLHGGDRLLKGCVLAPKQQKGQNIMRTQQLSTGKKLWYRRGKKDFDLSVSLSSSLGPCVLNQIFVGPHQDCLPRHLLARCCLSTGRYLPVSHQMPLVLAAGLTLFAGEDPHGHPLLSFMLLVTWNGRATQKNQKTTAPTNGGRRAKARRSRFAQKKKAGGERGERRGEGGSESVSAGSHGFTNPSHT